MKNMLEQSLFFTAEDDITDDFVIITINLDCKSLNKILKFFKKISKNSQELSSFFPVLHSFPTNCNTETLPFIVDTLGHLDLKSNNT